MAWTFRLKFQIKTESPNCLSRMPVIEWESGHSQYCGKGRDKNVLQSEEWSWVKLISVQFSVAPCGKRGL